MPIHHSILENGYLFSGKGSFVPAHLLGPYLVEYVDCVEFHRKYYLLLKSLRPYYCMISWKTKCSTMQKSGTLMKMGKMAEIRRSSNEGNCIVCQIVLFDMMPARLQWPIYYFNIDVPPNDWNSYLLFTWFYLFCASMLFGVWTFQACGDTWFGYDFSWEFWVLCHLSIEFEIHVQTIWLVQNAKTIRINVIFSFGEEKAKEKLRFKSNNYRYTASH